MVSGNDAGPMSTDGPQPKGLKRFRIYSWIPFYIIGGAVALILTVRLLWPAFGPELMLNYTHSEPYGIYRLERIPAGQLTRGMMVAFPVPESFRDLVVERGWVNAGHPLMKQIGALAGDEVCMSDSSLRINGQRMGPVFTVDSLGRAMPSVRGCMKVKPGEFFPLSTFDEKSFDGRYIGAVPLSAITGKLEPLWTF
jgi:conjugative transfer signal peptidase TraF